MVRQLCPEISDAELAECLARRAGIRRGERESLILQGQNLDLLAGVVDGDDALTAKQWKEQSHEASKARKAAAVDHLREQQLLSEVGIQQLESSAGLRKAPSAPVQRAPPTKDVWAWEEQHLKARLPSVKGCTIQDARNAHATTWTARYPGCTPGSRSRSYGHSVSSEPAAKHCFAWAWARHTEATGVACPYQIF